MKTTEERLETLRQLLIDTQFDHPDQRTRLIDDFYSEVYTKSNSELHDEVEKVYLHALGRRTFWAKLEGQINTARAVAYQSIAGDLLRILDRNG